MLGVGVEGIETGFGAKVNGFATIFGGWKILWISVKNTLANCGETSLMFEPKILCHHCHTAFIWLLMNISVLKSKFELLH